MEDNLTSVESTPAPISVPPQPKISSRTTITVLSLALVVLVGFGLYVSTSLLKAPQSTNTQSEPPIPSQEDWQTYTNSQYGFSFQHPSDAKLYQSPEGINPNTFTVSHTDGQPEQADAELAQSGYFFNVTVRGLATGVTVDQVSKATLSGAKENCYAESTFTPIVDTTVVSRPAKSYSVTNCLGDYTEYFVSNGRYVFAITRVHAGEQTDKLAHEVTTSQILSTFKFTSTTDTSNWKTYTHSSGLFSFNYPSDLVEVKSDDSITIADKNQNTPYVVFFYPKSLTAASEFRQAAQAEADSSTPQVSAITSLDFAYPALGFTEDMGSDSWENVITRPNSTSAFYIKAKYRTGLEYQAQQILSTFKFQDPLQPYSDWKSYTSAELGYSFKYPASWNEVIDPRTEKGNFTIQSPQNELIHGVIFEKNTASGPDGNGRKTFSLEDKQLLVTYVECDGPGCGFGKLEPETFDQILSTFKFTN